MKSTNLLNLLRPSSQFNRDKCLGQYHDVENVSFLGSINLNFIALNSACRFDFPGGGDDP